MGISFRIAPSDVDEALRPGEDALTAARRIARRKAEAQPAENDPVLAADTLVFLEDRIFGKPADDEDARRMLGALSGRVHSVVTAVVLRSGALTLERSSVSRVRFASLTEAEIAAYVASGEPADKAGAYALQGGGARFIEGIDGSPSNVIGLPARAVYELLREAGLESIARPPADRAKNP